MTDGRKQASTEGDDVSGSGHRLAPIKVVVTQTVEWEVTLDPADPVNEWLLDLWHNPDEVVACLDECASETEGQVERLIGRASPTGAWREVGHA